MRKKTRKKAQRVTNDNTKSSRLLRRIIKPSLIKKRRKRYATDRLYDDGRAFKFEIVPQAYTTSGNRVSYRLSEPEQQRAFTDKTRFRIGFADPRRVTVCIRRKRRRKALFVKNKVGRGKRVSPVRRMSEFSKIKC